jgi:mRNA-degrading endonuclease RelE of RelBE toxin-antitoxin system
MSKDAKKAFDNLPSASKQAIFDALKPLLESQNPLRCIGVCKVQGLNDVWRVHADTHNLRLRVFFTVVSGAVVLNDFEYNGKLIVGAIRKKDENTYSK